MENHALDVLTQLPHHLCHFYIEGSDGKHSWPRCSRGEQGTQVVVIVMSPEKQNIRLKIKLRPVNSVWWFQ